MRAQKALLPWPQEVRSGMVTEGEGGRRETHEWGWRRCEEEVGIIGGYKGVNVIVRCVYGIL